MGALLFALGIVPMANLVAPGLGLEWWGQSVRLWLVWSVLLVGVSLFLARFVPRGCDAFVSRLQRTLLRPSAGLFAVIVGIVTALLALFFSRRMFNLHPVTIDELSEQWQALLLAHGRLSARAEPHGDFFSTMQTVQVGDRWFAHFPIGASVLLSAGMAVGAPWLVNPILAGVAAIVIYRFVRRISTETEARIVALLFALSPFVLFMAASELDHLGALVALWMAFAALPRWVAASTATEASRSAAAIGVAVGVAATIRPYDAALVGAAIGAFQLWTARRNPLLVRSLAVQALSGAIPIAILFGVNAATTGHPLTFAYDVLNGPEHRPGFHIDPFGLLHTPRRGVYNISAYLMRLDVSLLAWPVPALVLVVVTLAWQRRASHWDLLLVGALSALLAGYWAYWGEGRSLGPRFLFSVVPIFLIYVARFTKVVRERVTSTLMQRAVPLLVPLCLLVSWLSPATKAQPFGVWTLAKRTQERDSVTTLVTDMVARQRLTHAVVFLSDGWHARLAARLRSLGARPFMAQKIVGLYDACLLQQLLDSAERTPNLAQNQTAFVFAELDRAAAATPVPGLPALEQIALDTTRLMTPQCEREAQRARSNGVDVARFLPLQHLDASGRLDGDVVYARDFGERNGLLRERFRGRAWYVARVEPENGVLRTSLTPIRAP
jgi:hypothetical protein